MKNNGPKKLVVCLLKTRWGDPEYEEIHRNAIQDHARYMSDLWQKGIFWAGGPLGEGSTAMEIFAVDSIEEAMEAQQNAPQYLSGYLYADEYHEWNPRHWPPARADIDPASGKLLEG